MVPFQGTAIETQSVMSVVSALALARIIGHLLIRKRIPGMELEAAAAGKIGFVPATVSYDFYDRL
jgi:hypothetical protein